MGDRHKPYYDHLTPPEPKNLYACTKIFGESLGQLYSRVYGLSVICLRLGQPYPIHHSVDEAWKANRRSRSIYVAMSPATIMIVVTSDARVSILMPSAGLSTTFGFCFRNSATARWRATFVKTGSPGEGKPETRK